MNIQNLWQAGVALLLATGSFAQSFQTTVYEPKSNFNHCSVEQTAKGYVTVGTRFQEGNNDIHIVYFDTDGVPIWEQFIDKTEDDRGLDVTIDDKDNIVLTGYLSPNGWGNPDLYIAKLDISGNMVADRLLVYNEPSGYEKRSGGTNIIYSEKRDTYVVGGYLAKENRYPLVENGAFVAEFSTDLDLIQDRILFRNYRHQAINDIVEVRDGFFVTGGLSYTRDRQTVMAIKLDYNLSIDTDLSFESRQTFNQCGVSLVYDEKNDVITILSNNGKYQSPQLTVFSDLSTGSPVLMANYVLDLTLDEMGIEPAGFKLEQSLYHPELLVASGYFKEAINAEGENRNALAWIIEFEAFTGRRTGGLVWENPDAYNFAYHGGEILSSFLGSMPYVYTQEMMTTRLDKDGYVLIAPRRLEDHFGFDIVTTNHLEAMDCFRPLKFEAEEVPFKRLSADQTIVDWDISKDLLAPEFIKSEYLNFCDLRRKNRIYEKEVIGDKNKKTTVDVPHVFPNPGKDVFTIEFPGEYEIENIQLFNSQGQLILTEKVSSKITTIDATGFPSGIYWLKSSDSAGKVHQTKLVITD